MSKTVITISVDKKIKEDFAKYAENLGTDMSSLIRMFMATSPNNPILNFRTSRFDEEEPTEEEKIIISEYIKDRDNGTFETFSAEEVFAEIGYKSKNV